VNEDRDHGWEAYKDAFPAGKNIRESGGDTPPVDAQPVEPLTAEERVKALPRYEPCPETGCWPPMQESTTGGWLARLDVVRALDAARAGEGLREAGRIAIEYVAAAEADWAVAKDPHETDDDLEPTWVAFRDAIKAAALHATATEEQG
jgi:hypothetical protein